MVKKYPLKLKPVLKDYIWGGRRLIDEFGFESSSKIAAEAWMLSLHKDGTNIVLNGAYKGFTLDKVLNLFGEILDNFPLLIKLIDAKDKLSVQVHPDDEFALKNEGEQGKTEMWYVVDCEEGAQLVFGFNKDTERQEFKEKIQNNTLDSILNYVMVKKGDVFFIKAGTLHAIGGGILIAEIQQNSNTTYRVSDYGRLGQDGKPRELHIDKALLVTNTLKSDKYCDEFITEQTRYGSIKTLCECEYFKVKRLDLDGIINVFSDKFISLLVLEGNSVLSFDNEKMDIKKGDSIFVPGSVSFTLSGKAEIIMSTK